MADDAATDLQSLTADIVSAYVSNNALSAEELSKLIVDTYQALSKDGTPEPVEPETGQGGDPQEHSSGLSHVLPGRPPVQEPEAAPQHRGSDARRLPHPFWTAEGLPHGGAELLRPAQRLGQDARPRPQGGERSPGAGGRARTAAAPKPGRGRKAKAIKPEDETFT